MRSAAVLLELPQGEGVLPAGADVRAVLLPGFDAALMPLMTHHQRGAVAFAAGGGPAAHDHRPPGAPVAAVASPSAGGGPHEYEYDSPIRVAILTVSDTVALHAGPDASGPAAEAALSSIFATPGDGNALSVTFRRAVPDDVAAIQAAILEAVDGAAPPHLLVTSGGTGFAPRDVTPEAVRPLLSREAPGLATAILNYRQAGGGRGGARHARACPHHVWHGQHGVFTNNVPDFSVRPPPAACISVLRRPCFRARWREQGEAPSSSRCRAAPTQ